MVATGDMSVVSREYEKSIIKAWKNFVAGDIVRMVSKNRILLVYAVVVLGMVEPFLILVSPLPQRLGKRSEFRAIPCDESAVCRRTENDHSDSTVVERSGATLACQIQCRC